MGDARWLTLLALVLAGCAAPTAPPPPPDTTSPSPPTGFVLPSANVTYVYDDVADQPTEIFSQQPCANTSADAFLVRFPGLVAACRISDHAMLRFQSGSPYATPALEAGMRPRATYGLYDLRVANHSAFWDNGTLFDLRHVGCDIQHRFTDVPEDDAANCTTAVRAVPSGPPRTGDASGLVPGAGGGNSTYQNNVERYWAVHVSAAPLLALLEPDFTFEAGQGRPLANFRGYGPADVPLPFQVIVADGFASLRVSPGDLYRNVTKVVRIGGAEVAFTPHHTSEADDLDSGDFSYELHLTRVAPPAQDSALLAAFDG
jgi:hypothetical protein